MKDKDKEFEFVDRLDGLIGEFEKSAHGSDHQKKLKKSIEALENSLDFLRISIKYLVFDLEATRRENERLKQIIADDYDDDDEVIG